MEAECSTALLSGVCSDQAVFGGAANGFAHAFQPAQGSDALPRCAPGQHGFGHSREGISGDHQWFDNPVTVADIAKHDPKRIRDKRGDGNHHIQFVHTGMECIDDVQRQDRSDHAAGHISKKAHPSQCNDVFIDHDRFLIIGIFMEGSYHTNMNAR